MMFTQPSFEANTNSAINACSNYTRLTIIHVSTSSVTVGLSGQARWFSHAGGDGLAPELGDTFMRLLLVSDRQAFGAEGRDVVCVKFYETIVVCL